MAEIELQTLERIVVVRALPGLGDFLCAIPALRAIRTVLPQARITYVGLPSNRALAARFSAYIDEIVALPGYPGLPEQTPDLEQLDAFLVEMRSRHFNLAIQMHGSGVVTNQLTLELGAQQTAGFFLPGQACPNPKTFLPFQESESEIRRYLKLLALLGIPGSGTELEFPIQAEEEEALKTLPLQPPYVCIHPGASVSARRWAASQFAIVGDVIAQMGYQVVLTGAQSEWELTDAIIRMMSAPAVNLAGQTDLGTLAGLLRDAELLICNDTGVSHLAAAVKAKSIVIFSQSDPQRWAPLDQELHRSLYGSAGVSTGAVLDQIHQLLKRESVYV